MGDTIRIRCALDKVLRHVAESASKRPQDFCFG